MKLYYITGEPLPKYRGILHYFVTIIIFFILVLYTPPIFKKLYIILFLLGKFISYSISAFLHLGVIKDINFNNTFLFIDEFSAHISIFVTSLPFLKVNDIFIYIFCSIILLFFAFTTLYFNYKNVRLFIFLIQFIFSIFYIGKNLNFNTLWIIGTLFYLISFIFFLPCVIYNSQACLFFWHKKHYYGCHEDFHNFLLIADIIFLYCAVNYLK